jgi:hypothetical protein
LIEECFHIIQKLYFIKILHILAKKHYIIIQQQQITTLTAVSFSNTENNEFKLKINPKIKVYNYIEIL